MRKRADGIQINSTDRMYELIPYIMEKRYDAQNFITLNIPVEPMERYIRAKRREGTPISHLALIICAYLRTAAEYPYLNRFIMHKRIYARNEFPVSMVVLKPGTEEGTMNKMYLEMTDDILTVQKKIEDYVNTNRQPGDNNKTDEILGKLLTFPALCGFLVNLIKWADRHNLLSKSILDASPFHVSLVVSNLASIRTNHIYHHLYEFGTASVFATLGNMREVPMRKGGEMTFVRCLPLGVVMDERICSGSYYALCFARIRAYLTDPTLMEGPPKVVNPDPGIAR